MLDLLDWDKEKFIKVDEKEDRYEIQMRFVLEKELQKERKEKDAYSMEEFYKKYSPILKHDNFVVITLDKETNQLLSCLMWKDERKKTLLSRDQCLDKALQFWSILFRMQPIMFNFGIIMKRKMELRDFPFQYM